MAFYRLHPQRSEIGEDLRAGTLAAIVARGARMKNASGKAPEPADFFPRLRADRGRRGAPRTWQQARDILSQGFGPPKPRKAR